MKSEKVSKDNAQRVRLVQLKEKSGLSYKEIARICGIQQSTVESWAFGYRQAKEYQINYVEMALKPYLKAKEKKNG